MRFLRRLQTGGRPGFLCRASFLTAALASLLPNCLQAQIRTDGTVGAAMTLTGPHFQIPDSLGTIRGQNLFQSFQTFNLSSGQSATFTGPNSIANVFSRVTGGSVSSIDGLLQCTIPNANFFFINPAGVLFGPNAQVDVQGAFAVTTADYIRFADGGRFDARTPANDVLTVANPAAFGFLTPPAGQSLAGVTFNNCTVQVPNGQTLTVAAGAVQVQNDPAIAPGGTAVKAPGGTLQVAAVASAGELPVVGLDTTSFSALGSMTLSGNSLFSTSHSGGGGQFLLRAQDLSLSGNAAIANNSLDYGTGGASEIDLRGTLSLTSGGFIATGSTGQAGAGSLNLTALTLSMDGGTIYGATLGSGAAANITINAPTISLQNGSWILADTHDLGTGGTIAVNASEVSLQSSSYISADAYGLGSGGTIIVNAPAVSLANSSTLSADTYGPGPGGAVTLNAQSVRVLSDAAISSDCRLGASGNAGIVTIQAGTVQLDNGVISAASGGTGAGGQVQISSQSLSVAGQNDGGEIDTIASGDGPAGNISITTGQLTLNPGGQIASGTFGAGRAGNITIQATDIVLNEGEISASTSGAGAGGDVRIVSDTLSLTGPTSDARINTTSLGSGQGGNISITTGELALKAGGVIISDALDAGRAGNVTIQATDIALDQGRISASTSGTGAGGDVRISSDTLSLSGGSIDTSSYNSGHAGNIFISTGEMTLDQSALIFAAPLGPSGDGGDIQITARDLTIQNGSGIGSDSYGGGVAGSIQLTLSGRCLVDSGNIHAASFGANQGGAAGDIVVQANDLEIRGSGFISTATYGNGAGGNVNITAATMLVTDTGSISANAASSASGQGGNIVVNAGTLQISQHGSLVAVTFGSGPAGTVRIQANDLDIGDFGFISTSTSGNGAGGNINITADRMSLTDSGFVMASSFGDAPGGAVSIQAGQLQIQGAQPFSIAGIHSFGALSGPAGSIEIQTGQLSLANGQIECEANQGDAGNITIQSGNAITLNNSALRVDSVSGNAGTITLSAPGTIALQNSLVGAFAGLNGGNITFDSQILGLVDSSLNANALTGNGGHISITADFLYQLGNSSITAISQNLAAQPGTISISSGVEFANSLSALPITPLQETSKIREGCARKNPRANSLIVRGKGGVAARPDAFLPLYDLRLEPADQL
jgi:filamentous hemagglutinin family protein